MIYSMLIIFILLIVAILSPLTILYANKLSLADVANHRSSHEGVTPRGGGIVFIIVFYIGLFIYFLINGLPNTSVLIILLCALIMAIVGWLDDFKDLSVKIRFGIQFLVVLISCLFIPYEIWPTIPFVIEKTVLVLAWMWFINLFNFMDGTDGYAAQETFFISIGLFIIGSSIGCVALILGFAVLGFLRVNYPKAKIFMGDVGSIFLGYILGGFVIYSIVENNVSIVQAVILTSLFSIDATYTLLKRGLQGKKVWKAHREHWYQRLNIAGGSHKQIFWIGLVYNFIMILILYLGSIGFIPTFVEVAICIILLVGLGTCVKRKEAIYTEKTE